MASEQHQHDITDAARVVIEPNTIENEGRWGELGRYSEVYQRKYSGFYARVHHGGA